jgi:CheY-like chemotaxis protein
LLDVHLTDLHGFEVLERLQGDSRTVDIPVVVLSADATTWQRRRFRNAGVYDYLSKPLNLQQLLDVIDQHVGARAASKVIANAPERITTS